MLKLSRNNAAFAAIILLSGASSLFAAGPITTITIGQNTDYIAGASTSTIFINTFGVGASIPDALEVVTLELLSGGSVISNGISPNTFTTTGSGIVNGGNVGTSYTLFRAGNSIQIRATSAGGITLTGTTFSVSASSATKLVVLGPGMTHAPGTNPATTTGVSGSFTPQEPNQAFTVTVILTDNQFNTVSAADNVSFPGPIEFVTLPSAANLSGGQGDFEVTMTGARVTRTLTVIDNTDTSVANGTLSITTAGPAAKEVFPFPSPFNPHQSDITFRFRLSEPKHVRLVVTDLFGQNIWERELSASLGFNDVTWNGRNDSGVVVAVGVYTVMLEIDGSIESRKRFGVTK